MEVFIEKTNETARETIIKLYNPEALDHQVNHRIKSIEFTDEYTRIDFLIRGSQLYINGGWIMIDRNSFIRPVGSNTRYKLIKAVGIPYAPQKHYFKRKGEPHAYTLYFPALPKDTKSIDIIEREAPGTYFNFYDVRFSEWMQVQHPLDVARSNN